MKAKKAKRVVAKAKCAQFDISVSAEFTPSANLAGEEIQDIQRKLRQKIAEAVASLPFAHIYSHEVHVR